MKKALKIYIIHLLVAFSTLLFSQTEEVTSHNTQNIIAHSLEEIKEYGITVYDFQNCLSTYYIRIYPDSNFYFRTSIDSIQSHKFIKYKRLSDIVNTPYWAPRKEDRLPKGERFKINQNGMMGWLPDENNVMTFNSIWRERIKDKLLMLDSNLVVCLYSSGQNETSWCWALTIWEYEQSKNLYGLKTYKILRGGKYTIPVIDSLYRDDSHLLIDISRIGGDAGDIWGSRYHFSYKDGELIKESEIFAYSIETLGIGRKTNIKIIPENPADDEEFHVNITFTSPVFIDSLRLYVICRSKSIYLINENNTFIDDTTLNIAKGEKYTKVLRAKFRKFYEGKIYEDTKILDILEVSLTYTVNNHTYSDGLKYTIHRRQRVDVVSKKNKK